MNITDTLRDMVEEVEHLRREFGLVPVRYHGGAGVMLALSKIPTVPAGDVPAVATFNDIPVMFDPSLAGDEWAIVYRGSR